MLLLSILLLGQVFGQDYDPTYFDPEHPEMFDYINGDYSTIIDWNQVNWALIPAYRIQEISPADLNYLMLNPGQRLGMTVEQIAFNLEQIQDLANDVDETKAREAIEEQTGIRITDLGRGAKIENNVLKSTSGQKDSLNLDKKEGWIIKINEKGEIIVSGTKPEHSGIIIFNDFSTQDSFTIENMETLILSEETTLREVNRLSFSKNQFYVKAGESASFNKKSTPFTKENANYLIPECKNRVDVYFDGEVHHGNYLSFGASNLIIGSVPGGEVKLEPQPGNDLFKMVQWGADYSGNKVLVADERNKISLKVTGGNGLSVTDRTKENKIPLYQSNSLPGGITEIETGRGILIRDENGKIFVKPPNPIPGEKGDFDRSNSVPFELVTNMPGQKLLVSSSNRVRLTDKNYVPIIGYSNGLKVTNELDFNLIKNANDLEEVFAKYGLNPSLDYDNYLPGEGITANMAQVVAEWVEKNPEKAGLIKGIHFSSVNNAWTLGVNQILIGERAVDPETSFQSPFRELTNPLETLNHEYNHLVDYSIEEKEKAGSEKSEKKLYELYADLAHEAKREIAKSDEFKEFCEISSEPERRWAGEFSKAEMEKMAADTDYALELVPKAMKEKGKSHEKEDIALLSWVVYTAVKEDRTDELVGTALLDPDFWPEELGKDYLKKAYTNAFVVKGGEYVLHDSGREELKVKEESGIKIEWKEKIERYPEVGTVPLELRPNRAARAIQNGNEFIRKSTQIAYDAGKISASEYHQRMGGYCNIHPCGKCLIYKLACVP